MRLTSIFGLLLYLFSTKTVFAALSPSFPSCLTPSGQVIASYDSGSHGIVGIPGEHLGSDRVYKVNDTNFIQCYCSSDGSGIGTDWWDASALSAADLSFYEKTGWTYVASGSTWGLASSPFLARNTSYRCSGETVLGGSSEEASSSGQVLGLAATGNTLELLILYFAGLFLVTLGSSRLTKESSHDKNS